MDQIGRASCLIVDDEAPLRQLLVQLMRGDGFDCAEAANGREALQYLETHRVTLVISDLRMPEVDGRDLLREIRARYPDTAVMLLTAVADVDVAVNCLAIGAADYLTKPFHIAEVRARVLQALERRRLVMENRDYQERLEERVAAQARKLEALFLTGIQSLAEALEVKDPYTRGHSIRVSHYSSVIARTLHLDDEMIYQIELGGQLHDLGKIGVRESVLNKRGHLTPEEYAHVMTHPVVGWRILTPLLGEAPIALSIVRSHHERMDGTGVPDQLRGRAIPLEARIAAVADALDAMTSGRPYRAAEMTLEGAVAELRNNVGHQFDGGVVKAVTEAVASGNLALVPKAVAPAERGVPGKQRHGIGHGTTD